jgi:hypothetical protein
MSQQLERLDILQRKIPMQERTTVKTKRSHQFFLFIVTTIACLVIAELMVRAFADVRNVGPSFTVYDPVYGKRLKSNFHDIRRAPEFEMTFTTNSMGFRGAEPESESKRTLLFLGDSFTMGYGVSDGEEYPALIKKKLAEIHGGTYFNVVNTGMAGNGNGRWVKFLGNELGNIEPSLVVFQMLDNDFSDNFTEGLFSLDESGDLYELPLQKSKMRTIQQVVDSIRLVSNSHLYSFLRERLWYRGLGLNRQQGVNEEVEKDTDELTYRLLIEAIEICNEANHSALLLVVDITGDRLARLRQIADQYEVPYLEIPGKKDRPNLYYTVDGHWNKSGHVAAADLIMNKILHDGLLDVPAP